MEVTGHAGQTSEEVEGGADVLRPSAESTPQVLNLLEMIIAILQYIAQFRSVMCVNDRDLPISGKA